MQTGRSDNSQVVLQTEQTQLRLRMQGSPVFIAPEAILDRTAYEHNEFMNHAEEQAVVPLIN